MSKSNNNASNEQKTQQLIQKHADRIYDNASEKQVKTIYTNDCARVMAFVCMLVLVWSTLGSPALSSHKAPTYEQVMWTRAIGFVPHDEEYTLFTHLCVRTIWPIAEPLIVGLSILGGCAYLSIMLPYTIIGTSIWFLGLLRTDLNNTILCSGIFFDSIVHRRWLLVKVSELGQKLGLLIQLAFKNLQKYLEG